MKCIIVEDQPPAQRILKKYIADLDSLQLMGTYGDALKALEYMQQEQIDLVFLDIHLPKMSGLDLLKSLQHRPYVILTTAFAEYALESYEYDVVDYLLKPFSFQRFVRAVSKLPGSGLDGAKAKDKQSIFIKSGYEYVKIAVPDIAYIHSDADYTEIHTPEKKHLSYQPLKHWISLFDPKLFAQIHKSYVVNITKIEKVGSNELVLLNGETLPIGRAFREPFMEKYIR